LIGIGTSAISRLTQGYAQTVPDVSQWRQSIEAGRLAVGKGKALDADDGLRGDLIEQLMCRYSVDISKICAQHGLGLDRVADSLQSVYELAADGLVDIAGSQITMTEDGRPFVRVVAAAFDAYLPKATARHSVAV
jgi:oxygen-independent coproporphyrinogen-3 oxidase